MDHDRQLIEVIKAHFARKSAAQLQEIVQGNNPSRWSPEAIAAAGEVLQDRIIGRAEEPPFAEEEPPPPPIPPDPYSLAFLAFGALGGLAGLTLMPVYRVDYTGGSDPDLPVPFSSRIAWLAIDTTDTNAVAAALELGECRSALWAEGIAAAYRSSLFITPPLADWTLAVSRTLFPPERAESFIKPLVERLSRQFGEVQYFCTHSDVGLHIWARARRGQLSRGYGWLGEKNLTMWDEGAPTKEERDLSLSSIEGEYANADHSENQNYAVPNEAFVMRLAALWSIDPSALDEQFKEPEMGLLGNPKWTQSPRNRNTDDTAECEC